MAEEKVYEGEVHDVKDMEKNQRMFCVGSARRELKSLMEFTRL